jgi:hypothetical protein
MAIGQSESRKIINNRARSRFALPMELARELRTNSDEYLGSRAANPNKHRSTTMSLGTILLVILVLALIGAFPAWGYNSGWGYYPTGGIGLILLIVIILLVLGRI